LLNLDIVNIRLVPVQNGIFAHVNDFFNYEEDHVIMYAVKEPVENNHVTVIATKRGLFAVIITDSQGYSYFNRDDTIKNINRKNTNIVYCDKLDTKVIETSFIETVIKLYKPLIIN